MALETVFFILQELLKLNAFVLLGLVFAFAFIAYKILQLVLKVLVTGVAFATFPVIANVVGIPIPLTMQSILWSAIAGIVILFAYTGIRFVFKLLNVAFYPLKKGFANKKNKPSKVRKEKH